MSAGNKKSSRNATSSSSGMNRSGLASNLKEVVKTSLIMGKESISELRRSIMEDSFYTTQGDSDDEMFKSAQSVFSTGSSRNMGSSLLSESEDDWKNSDLVVVHYDPIVRRDLTKIYGTIRIKQIKQKRQRESENVFFTDDSSLQHEGLLSFQDQANPDHHIVEMVEKSEEDGWEEVYSAANDLLRNISINFTELKRLHQQHVTFTVHKDFTSEEIKIKSSTDVLKQAIMACKKLIEKLDPYIVMAKKKKRHQLENVLVNVKRSLTTSLSEISTEFQFEQKNFLDKLTELKSKKKDLQKMYANEQADEFSKEELERIESIEQKFYEPNVSQEQVQELMIREREIIRRDKELREILNSIVELHDMFQQISSLIIEQGTMLDRIDHNIETTFETVKKGTENLRDAEKAQGMGCTMMIIVGLSIIVVVLALLVIIKLRYVLNSRTRMLNLLQQFL